MTRSRRDLVDSLSHARVRKRTVSTHAHTERGNKQKIKVCIQSTASRWIFFKDSNCPLRLVRTLHPIDVTNGSVCAFHTKYHSRCIRHQAVDACNLKSHLHILLNLDTCKMCSNALWLCALGECNGSARTLRNTAQIHLHSHRHVHINHNINLDSIYSYQFVVVDFRCAFSCWFASFRRLSIRSFSFCSLCFALLSTVYMNVCDIR